MQFSQLVNGSGQKFSSDSSFFIHYENAKLYIKQSSVNLKNIGIINAPSSITEADISPDSKYVSIFMNKKSTILVYRIEDCTLAAKIQDPQPGISSYFWANDSIQILVFSEYLYKVSIYNFVEKSVVAIKNPKLGNSKGFAFSNNGKFLALLEKHESKEYLSIYFTIGWKMVNNFQLQLFDASQVRWSPNNSVIAVWDNCINYRMLIYCHTRGLVFKYEPYTFALGIKSVQFSADSLFLAIGSFDEKIRLLNAITWQQISILDCSNPVVNSQNLIVYKEEEINKNQTQMKRVQTKQFKINTMKVSNSVQKGTPNQGIGLLQFSQNSQFLACKNDNMPYTVWIWEISRLEPTALISCNTPIKSIKWTKQETMLSIIFGTDRVLFWRPDNTIAQCIFNFHNKNLNIQKMKWNNDRTKLLLGDKSDFAYAELLSDSLT